MANFLNINNEIQNHQLYSVFDISINRNNEIDYEKELLGIINGNDQIYRWEHVSLLKINYKGFFGEIEFDSQNRFYETKISLYGSTKGGLFSKKPFADEIKELKNYIDEKISNYSWRAEQNVNQINGNLIERNYIVPLGYKILDRMPTSAFGFSILKTEKWSRLTITIGPPDLISNNSENKLHLSKENYDKYNVIPDWLKRPPKML